MPVDLQEARLVEGFETVLENIHALQSASLQSWASDLLSHSEQLCSGLLEYLKSTTLSDEKSSWGNNRFDALLKKIKGILWDQGMHDICEEISFIRNIDTKYSAPEELWLRKMYELLLSITRTVGNWGRLNKSA